MVNIKLGILEMVEKARAVIEEVDVEDAIAEARHPDCLIIDVRDVRDLVCRVERQSSRL